MNVQAYACFVCMTAMFFPTRPFLCEWDRSSFLLRDPSFSMTHVSSTTTHHDWDWVSPYSRSTCSSSKLFTLLTLCMFFLRVGHLTHALQVLPLHGLPWSHLCMTICVISACMHFTIYVTVYHEHEPTCIFTLVLSLLLMVSILVSSYLHLSHSCSMLYTFTRLCKSLSTVWLCV